MRADYRTCHHDGLHRIGAYYTDTATGPKVITYARTVVEHAAALARDDEGGDVTITHVDLAERVVARDEAPGEPRWCVEASTLEVEALVAVLELGIEYMLDNDYADDPDFPEDAAAARYFRNDAQARWFALCHLTEPQPLVSQPSTGVLIGARIGAYRHRS